MRDILLQKLSEWNMGFVRINLHLRCWELCIFYNSPTFGGATLVALKRDGNNERKRELLKNPLQDKIKIIDIIEQRHKKENIIQRILKTINEANHKCD